MARGIPSDVVRHFQEVPMFGAISKKHLRSIIQATTEMQVAAGKTLVKEGDLGRHLYVIVEGTASVTQKGRKIASMGPGDFFGELAFLDHAPRSATVTATSDMKVMVLGPQELDVLVDREPVLGKRMLQQAAKRLRSSEKSISH